MKTKYEKIDIDDVFDGDVIYFNQRQEGNDKPYKYRPFLVMGIQRYENTIDLVPITHSDPKEKEFHDMMSAYNVIVTGNLQKLLQQRSKDNRPSFFNVAQREIVDRSEFGDTCDLQLMISDSDYKFSDWKTNEQNITDMRQIIDDAYPGHISRFALSQMHIVSLFDKRYQYL